MITVLTKDLYYLTIRRRIWCYYQEIHRLLFKEKIRGPASHLKCLLRGLEKLNVNYNLNPSINNIYSIVFVPNNPYVLEQAVKLKKDGVIEKLIAGPNVAVFPQDFEIISAKEIDYYLQSNVYYKELWMTLEPKLVDKIVLYPVGVDEKKWEPKSITKTGILIYYKECQDDNINIHNMQILSKCEEYLKNKKIKFTKMVYGTHSQEEYFQNLNESTLLIIFGGLEGSPTSHVEAWSMNVPTLVALHTSQLMNGKNVFGSSSPYLSDQTGSFFSNIEQLIDLVNERMLNNGSYSPRQWVETHMTDRICTDNMLRDVKILS